MEDKKVNGIVVMSVATPKSVLDEVINDKNTVFIEYGGEDVVDFRDKLVNLSKTGQNVVWTNADATRKIRAKTYAHIKSADSEIPVMSLVYFQPYDRFKTILLDEKGMSEEESLSLYKKVQPPRVKVDCDSIYFSGSMFFEGDVFEFEPDDTLETFLDTYVFDEAAGKEFSLCYDKHDSPYHMEDINEHIDMCLKASSSQGMRILSLFHDLGKGICKIGGKYKDHQNVGAMYMLNACWSAGLDDLYIPEERDFTDFVDVILYHMAVDKKTGKLPVGISRRNKFSHELTKLTELFVNKIDSKSRISEEEFLYK